MNLSLSKRIDIIDERIFNAAIRSGRDRKEVVLLAASKGVDIKAVKEAISAGIRVFGENYIQEAQEKVEKIKKSSLKWHFIGHLQKNKVKYAAGMFDMIQTVDSYELARELNKRTDKPIDILIQVNLSGEKTKAGIDKVGAVNLAGRLMEMESLKLKGLMTLPPSFDDPNMSRPYYTSLRRLAEEINREHVLPQPLIELSMGMSNDFEVAIEEGATIVRIGTAIFGDRKTRLK